MKVSGLNILSELRQPILVLYILINLPVLLFLQGVFWDDWVLFNTSKSTILERFAMVGSPFNFAGYFHSFVMLEFGPWLYRVLVLVAFAANIILGNIILRNLGFSKNLRLFFVLSMATMPLFGSRFVAINSIYILCTTCFLGAWLAQQRDKHFIAPILYICAFFTQSYLVFFSIPYLLAYAPSILRLEFNRQKLILIALYTALPFSFFLVKTSIFSPSGVYSGYLTLDPYLIMPTFLRIIEVSVVNWKYSTAPLSLWDLSALAFFTAAFFVLIDKFILKPRLKDQIHINENFEKGSGLGGFSNTALFIIVIAVSLVAMFPYLIVGNELNFYYGFSSRNHTVFILPACLVVAMMLHKLSLFNRRLPALLLAMSATIQMVIYFAYGDDWRKQKAILNGLENIKQQVSNRHTFVVLDQSNIRNVEMRDYSWYEWSGIFRFALGRDGVFVRDAKYWTTDVCYKSLEGHALYNTGGFGSRLDNTIVRMTLKANNVSKIPLVGNIGYDLSIEPSEHDFCSKVCDKCGF